MKKSVLVFLTFILLFGFFAALPAASESKESDYYYVNVQILKIFPCKLGYYVIYRRAGLQTGEYYIPQKWLDRRDSRAVLNLTEQNVAPYLSIMMKNGEFDHIRIVAVKRQSITRPGVRSTRAPYLPTSSTWKSSRSTFDPV